MYWVVAAACLRDCEYLNSMKPRKCSQSTTLDQCHVNDIGGNGLNLGVLEVLGPFPLNAYAVWFRV